MSKYLIWSALAPSSTEGAGSDSCALNRGMMMGMGMSLPSLPYHPFDCAFPLPHFRIPLSPFFIFTRKAPMQHTFMFRSWTGLRETRVIQADKTYILLESINPANFSIPSKKEHLPIPSFGSSFPWNTILPSHGRALPRRLIPVIRVEWLSEEAIEYQLLFWPLK